jgi:hypothetical protein
VDLREPVVFPSFEGLIRHGVFEWNKYNRREQWGSVDGRKGVIMDDSRHWLPLGTAHSMCRLRSLVRCLELRRWPRFRSRIGTFGRDRPILAKTLARLEGHSVLPQRLLRQRILRT